MGNEDYYKAADPQNIVKTKIVAKYFGAWSNVMLPRLENRGGRLAYIDLFAGRGRFEDGKASTPLWILNKAINDPRLRQRLVTKFNEKDRTLADQLQMEIDNLPNVDRLAYKPEVSNETVGPELVELLRGLRLVPTLFFIDPWGYKGLSLDLIGQAIKNWGCDCIFFFNYNRINQHFSVAAVKERMTDLFGADRYEQLLTELDGRTPDERQSMFIENLIEALGEFGGKYVLPFEFQSEHKKRPSHYIIFVSKEFLGYHIMKDVMAGESSDDSDVKKFQYVPMRTRQAELIANFGQASGIDTLKAFLADACAGNTLSVWQAYEDNTVGTPYTLKNVRDALIALEAEGRLTVHGSKKGRVVSGQTTLSKIRTVTFPSQKGATDGPSLHD